MSEYSDKQEQWIKIIDLKIGDEVLCVVDSPGIDPEWLGTWSPEMNNLASKSGTVVAIDQYLGIQVNFSENPRIGTRGFWLPFTALVKVKQ